MLSLHFVTVKTLFQSRQKRRNSLIARLHETTTMCETCPSKTIERRIYQCKSRFLDAADYQCVLKYANHTFKHFKYLALILFLDYFSAAGHLDSLHVQELMARRIQNRLDAGHFLHHKPPRDGAKLLVLDIDRTLLNVEGITFQDQWSTGILRP